jgi:hypothetical protein
MFLGFDTRAVDLNRAIAVGRCPELSEHVVKRVDTLQGQAFVGKDHLVARCFESL